MLEALDPERYEAVPVKIGRDGRWELGPPNGTRELSGRRARRDAAGADRAGAAGRARATSTSCSRSCTGPFGEDGTVQGLLELADVPYVGAGVLASALCMDKDRFKAVMRGDGIPVARNVTLRDGDPVANPFGYPVFVKPARLGSSVGISKAHDEDELRAGSSSRAATTTRCSSRSSSTGIEVECGVLGNRDPIASLPGEIVALDGEWYDYSAEVRRGRDGPARPAARTSRDEQVERVQRARAPARSSRPSARAWRARTCFVRDDGEVLVNELNTIPGSRRRACTRSCSRPPGIPYASCSTA